MDNNNKSDKIMRIITTKVYNNCNNTNEILTAYSVENNN